MEILLRAFDGTGSSVSEMPPIYAVMLLLLAMLLGAVLLIGVSLAYVHYQFKGSRSQVRSAVLQLQRHAFESSVDGNSVKELPTLRGLPDCLRFVYLIEALPDQGYRHTVEIILRKFDRQQPQKWCIIVALHAIQNVLSEAGLNWKHEMFDLEEIGFPHPRFTFVLDQQPHEMLREFLGKTV